MITIARRRTLPSVPASASAALAFVERVAEEAQLPPALTNRLLLAAGEAVPNALRHGNAYDPLKHVQLVVTLAEDAVFLSVRDEGPGLTDAQLEGAHLPAPTARGGRGLYIIHHTADAVRLLDGGRCLLLRFDHEAA